MILETSKTQRNTNTYLTTVMGQLFSSFSYVGARECRQKEKSSMQTYSFLSATLFLCSEATVTQRR